jgi:integrase
MASITETTNGTWRVQIEFRGKREYRTFKKKSLATQYAIQREAELQKGQLENLNDAQRTTLSAVIERYEERVLPRKKGKGHGPSLAILKQHFGTTRLINLKAKDVADFRDTRLVDLKPATVVKDLNMLRVLLDYAKRDMGIYLPTNVARDVKNPYVRNERERVFYAGEEKLLLAAMTHPMLNSICRFAIETACRLGEILRLEWEDIDLKAHTAFISKTKLDDSRTIPLTREAITILKKIAPKAADRNGRIFHSWARADSITKTFRRAVEKARANYIANCEKQKQPADPRMLTNLNFHDFRHIAASRLSTKVPNVIELSLITGHRNLQTLKRYYHVSPEELAKKLRKRSQ